MIGPPAASECPVARLGPNGLPTYLRHPPDKRAAAGVFGAPESPVYSARSRGGSRTGDISAVPDDKAQSYYLAAIEHERAEGFA